MYNRAIQEASRLGIEELYKLYKEIGNYKLTEEEKKLLQENITFYIKEQKNMTKANIQQMLYFISTERQEDEKKIDLYNTALFEASKFGISFLHSIYKDIKNYNLSEEEKKLLQGNVTFYIGEQKDMSPEDVKEMLYFVNAERQDDEKKIDLFNKALFEASKFGVPVLHSIYKDIKNYKLTEEEKKLLQGNVTFYIGEQKDMTPEDLQQMLFFINTERQDDEKKIELYNKALFEASKLGSEVLEKIKNEIGSYNLTDEEKVLLQRNVDIYISEQQKNSTNTIESSAGRDR
jgi:uncharacterized phage-associated protein